jgi:C4-dicarboxylate-specific signal transduction histidine kinase
MIFIYVLVMFLFLERTTTHFSDLKRNQLQVACKIAFKAGNNEEAFQILHEAFHPGHNEHILILQAEQLKHRDRQLKQSKGYLFDAVSFTLQTGQSVTKRAGKTVGMIFVQHESMIATVPIKENGETTAAVGIRSPLKEIYQDFRRIQKIAFVFILIASLFFALIGNRQLSRVYFKPLQRLAKRAEAYKDDDPLFFAVRKEDNEFSVLSSSLNKMLRRIKEDKGVLQETIGSLQEANRELKKAQDEVIRAEKLATVGRLTSGIAHEIGNPIGIVLGYLDLMKQADLTHEVQNDFIARSETEIIRINNIIRQLLDMTRTSSEEVKNVSVHALLHDLVSVFAYQPSAGEISFEAQLEAAQDRVLVDPDRLRQVFLNILLNAVDALNTHPSSQPQILLITEESVIHSSESAKSAIRIRIEDNGPGIGESDMAHVFDPFFTTKQPGKGTGLGLSVAFMIIEELGGQLTVSKSASGGAAFAVTLPIIRNEGSIDEGQPDG